MYSNSDSDCLWDITNSKNNGNSTFSHYMSCIYRDNWWSVLDIMVYPVDYTIVHLVLSNRNSEKNAGHNARIILSSYVIVDILRADFLHNSCNKFNFLVGSCFNYLKEPRRAKDHRRLDQSGSFCILLSSFRKIF